MKLKIYESEKPNNYIEINHLNKPNLPAVVTFYRSKDNSEINPKTKIHNYGDLDKGYKGEFGFDRFDKDVIAEGLAIHYEQIDGVKTQQETIKNHHNYLCPYLSLYPPKVFGNKDNLKSKATLFVKLIPDINRTDGNPNFGAVYFESSNYSAIEIDGTSSHEIAKEEKKACRILLKTGAPSKQLTISCKKAFKEPVEITAKTSKGIIIGKLIVVPNNERYKTQIQPIEIKFSSSPKKNIINIGHSSIMKDVLDKFNNNSFNQAFINAEISQDTHEIVLSEQELKKYIKINKNGKREIISKVIAFSYNNFIEETYASLLNKGNNNNNNNTNKLKKELHKKGQNLLKKISKNYKYKKGGILKAREFYKAEVLTKIWESPKIQKAYKEYLKANDKYEKHIKKIKNILDKTHKIHVFYTNDIYGAYGGAAAYSKNNSGVAHIFKQALTHKSNTAAILHEIGHSLSLEHPFESKLGKSLFKEKGISYKQDVDEEIDKMEKKKYRFDSLIDFLKKLKTKNIKLTTEELEHLKEINIKYKIVQIISTRRKVYQVHEYEQIVERILKTVKLENIKIDVGNNINLKSINDKINENLIEINNKKLEVGKLKSAKKFKNYKDQSKTLENYMDYHIDSKGASTPNFKRKTYYKFQWDMMTNRSRVVKFLKQVK